ncbi:MAG: hypothetical protein ACK4K7_06720 [Allosphingosinicella sp.]|uniref:hypothetical protein n=1 Tax=Allosphingosinicella sp. TaxID=2823234 RepID=UPI0039387415
MSPLPPLPIVLTDAGLAAMVDQQTGGTKAVRIAGLGLTDQDFDAARTLVALPGEFRRLDQVAGMAVDARTIHLTARDLDEGAYTVRGFGLFLEDGTLFGAYCHPAPIFQKAGVAAFLFAQDIRFFAGEADLIQFGDANFAYPPATIERKGIAEIATQAEVDAGADEERFVVPKTLATRLAALLAAIAQILTSYIPLTQRGAANGVATLDGNARVPLGQLPALDFIPMAQRGANNGVATLDAGGKVPTAQLPSIAITEPFVVANQAAMLALNAQTGDVAIRTDIQRNFILAAAPATTLDNWVQLAMADAPVTSVNNKTGNVALNSADIGAIPTTQRGAANGVASLDGNTRVPVAQIPALDYVPTAQRGAANGVASLDGSTRVPVAQIPPLDYVPTAQRGAANGVASLDGNTRVPLAQIPPLDYVPTAQRGAANGVATLGADSRVPAIQLPPLDYIPLAQRGVANGVATLGPDALVPAGQLPASVPPTRSVTGAGLATGGGALDADRVITVTAATPTEVAAGASQDKAITPYALKQAWTYFGTAQNGGMYHPNGLLELWATVYLQASQQTSVVLPIALQTVLSDLISGRTAGIYNSGLDHPMIISISGPTVTIGNPNAEPIDARIRLLGVP